MVCVIDLSHLKSYTFLMNVPPHLQRTLWWLTGVGGLLFVAVLCIAGPIYKTVLFLKMAPTDRPLKLQFREEDYFHELTEAVNQAQAKK